MQPKCTHTLQSSKPLANMGQVAPKIKAPLATRSKLSSAREGFGCEYEVFPKSHGTG